MEFDYKVQLLLQAIFPNLVPHYIVEESFLGLKPLLEIIRDYIVSSLKNL